MQGIGATRSATGEIVEIGLDAEGRLCARTPDGSVLQAQPVRVSRVRLKADRLKWSGVEYVVDDHDEARQFFDSLAAPGLGTRRWVTLIAFLAIGLALGIFGGAYLNERRSRAGCDEAREVVDAALAAMAEINETEAQDQSFFAALIVEQREITYAMESEPRCFSLTERAEAEGLLEGIRGLLSVTPG